MKTTLILIYEIEYEMIAVQFASNSHFVFWV